MDICQALQNDFSTTTLRAAGIVKNSTKVTSDGPKRVQGFLESPSYEKACLRHRRRQSYSSYPSGQKWMQFTALRQVSELKCPSLDFDGTGYIGICPLPSPSRALLKN